MKALLNEGLQRKTHTSSYIFLAGFQRKNGKLIEEQNSVGCQYIQEKAKVHFCLQIQTLLPDQWELHSVAHKNHFTANILKDKAASFGYSTGLPELLWEAIFSNGILKAFFFIAHINNIIKISQKGMRGFDVCMCFAFPHRKFCVFVYMCVNVCVSIVKCGV